MPAVGTDVWPSVLQDIEKEIGEQRFSLWFRHVRLVRLEGDTFVLGVPNLFVREWLERHFLEVIGRCLAGRMGRAASVRFVVDAELFREARKAQLEANAAILEAGARSDKDGQNGCEQVNIRPDFTLETFVVGPGNKLAHACAVEIIESSSNRLNPLFIHSLSGLGKTHLLQAIWHDVHRRDDGRKVEYISGEAWANQFVYAMRTNRLDSFRHRYRNADILLIDDVHFISNKSGMQDELLHTCEALDAAKKQLVLASDVHPKMLTKLKQSLVNRFASGMVVRINAPDFATRVAILKAKLQQQGRRLPEEVIRYVARGFEGSVRDLTGAITLVLAYASLTGRKIDVALARAALARLEEPPAKAPLVGAIERTVARRYGLKPEDIRVRRPGGRAARFARQLCMYLARQCTAMSCREVARHFGCDNHSTVLFAVSRVEQAMKKDPDLAELIAAMKEQVRRG